jgi:hypothetical protein
VQEAFFPAEGDNPYPGFYNEYHNMQARMMLEYLISTMPSRS